MKRKVVQIISDPLNEDGGFVALASDGSIWQKTWTKSGIENDWYLISDDPLPDVPDPQPSPDAEPAFKVGDVVVCEKYGFTDRVEAVILKTHNRSSLSDQVRANIVRHATPAKRAAFERAEAAAKGGD